MQAEPMMILLAALAGLLLGVLLTLLFLRNSARSQYLLLREENDRALSDKERQIGELEAGRRADQDALEQAIRELATEQQKNLNLQERLRDEQMRLEELNEKMNKEFKLIAAGLLTEKGKEMREQQERTLKVVLDPLKERIKEFQEQVAKAYETEGKERSGLKKEINMLMEQNQKLSKEANDLAKALKGDVKMQGNWGEVILERLLERSGLVKDREYTVQESRTTDDGRRLQPDVVIQLPEDKQVVVDSKVSLVAYERMVNADDIDQQKKHLAEHVRSIRAHIKGLSDKNYQQLYGVQGLDFLLLFVPIEGAFTAALQADGDLYQEAFERNVLIVSPTMLLVTLRTIASVWKNEMIAQNHLDIAERAGKLYDKFVGFSDDMIKVGKQIRIARETYTDAMKKLSEGSGNLVRQTEKLKELGAKTSKTIDAALLKRAIEMGTSEIDPG